MKVKFIKSRIFKGKLRKKGETVEMNKQEFRVYSEFRAVKAYVENNKKQHKEIDLKKCSYKEIQKLCKKYNIQAVGKKQDLILLLNEKINFEKLDNSEKITQIIDKIEDSKIDNQLKEEMKDQKETQDQEDKNNNQEINEDN